MYYVVLASRRRLSLPSRPQHLGWLPRYALAWIEMCHLVEENPVLYKQFPRAG